MIELLAVIVILAIIALITVPIVLNIINDTKMSAFKRNIESYMSSVELMLSKPELDNIDSSTCTIEKDKIICTEKEYSIEIDGEYPKYVEIVYDEQKKLNFAIKEDGYCAIKTEDDKSIKYKKIVSKVKNENTEIKENMCSLDPHTSESCFEFDESTGTITKFYKYEGNDSKNDVCPKDVIIPNKIKGVDVVTIGGRVFYPEAVGVKIESVVIPSTVKTIKEGAFRYNVSLKKVTLNKGLEVIESGAFEFNGPKGAIKEITIPSTIKMIGNKAFQNQNIESLDLSNCTNLTSIGTLAFANNDIEKLILPKNQAITLNGAFNNNKLKEEDAYIYKRNEDGSIDYSEIVSYAGSLKDITIPGEKNGVKLNKISNNSFEYGYLTSIVFPDNVQEIGNMSFRYNKLKNLIIPGNIKKIGAQAFRFNSDLKKVEIQEGVEIIDGSFSECAIEEVSIPSTIKEIIGGAFSDSKIQTLDLSKCTNLNSIGVRAFANNNLENIILPQNQDILMYGAFNNNNMREDEAYIYKHTKDGIDYSEIVSYAGSLKDIAIPSEKNGIKLKTIGISSFNKINLTSVIIPEGVEIVNARSFYNNKLTSVTIPSSVTTIGVDSFRDNSTLIKIVNKTDKEFNWKSILSVSQVCAFKTGTCGKVTITDIED